MSSRLWSRFRKIRAILFGLCTLFSIAWTVIYTILLIREWSAYNMGQRAIVITLLSINGISSIFMYLMIVVRFTLWIDAARVSLILLFQLGGTIAFALASPVFPCNNVGSVNDCKNLTSVAIIGGWSLSGLLLFYAFLLAVMSYIPPSIPLPNPEEALSTYTKARSSLNHSPTPSINSETYLLGSDEKHRSIDSTSFYCRGSHIPPASLALMNKSSSRPNSPALSHVSSLRSVWSYGGHPVAPPRTSRASLYSRQILPNPFADPILRHTSPHSQASVSSSRSDNFGQESTRVGQFPRTLGLGSPPPHVYRTGSAFPPPYVEERRTPYQLPYVFSPPFVSDSPGSLIVPSTPISLRPAAQAIVPFRNYTASPGFQSIRSMSASMHSPTPSASFISRGVSPVPSGLPSSPRPVAFPPATTPLNKEGAAQVRRFGSESNILLDTRNQPPGAPGIILPSALRVALPNGQPSWITPKSDRNVDFKQWKEAVLGAAAGSQFTRQ